MPVCQIDLKTNRIIATYESMKDAAKKLELSNTIGISHACKGILQKSHGFKWRFIDPITKEIIEPPQNPNNRNLYYSNEKHLPSDNKVDRPISPPEHKNMAKKTVRQIDVSTNEIIGIYDGIIDASKALGKGTVGASHIADVCNGRRKTAYGYKWEFADDNPSEIKKIGLKQPVYQLNPITYEIITMFESIKMAALALGKNSRSLISGACHGIYKTEYDYKWCFVEDYDSLISSKK